MRIERKLADMGIELGTPGAPVANYIPTVRTGNLLFVAGHIPFLPDGSVLHTGKLGRDISEEQGYEAAKAAMVKPGRSVSPTNCATANTPSRPATKSSRHP